MVGYYDPEDSAERCMACKMPDGSLLTITDNGSTLTLCESCICNAHLFAGFTTWTPAMVNERARILHMMEKQHASRH